MLTATRNERIDNYSPKDNPQLTGKIPTEYHNVELSINASRAAIGSNQSKWHAEEEATYTLRSGQTSRNGTRKKGQRTCQVRTETNKE
ncbi:unnamed protein product [Echinostoma caproni]|uniref:Uncharacterized protein n=1 Tax=Echinostoma caproni TaxID=27848 RepID=A0A183A326_9TREM|nr:unnamed protein product [Echinostoma caproni]